MSCFLYILHVGSVAGDTSGCGQWPGSCSWLAGLFRFGATHYSAVACAARSRQQQTVSEGTNKRCVVNMFFAKFTCFELFMWVFHDELCILWLMNNFVHVIS